MKAKVNYDVDFVKTAFSGFNYQKTKPEINSDRIQDILLSNYKNTTRNVSYFKDILNYSRRTLTMTSFQSKAKTRNSNTRDDIKRIKTETSSFPLMIERSRMTPVAIDPRETLITQPNSNNLIGMNHRQAPSFYDLDMYYNQLETPTHKKIETANSNLSLSQTLTVLNTETYFRRCKQKAKRISTKDILHNQNHHRNNDSSNIGGENIFIDYESKTQDYIPIGSISDAKMKKSTYSNIKSKPKTASTKTKPILNDNSSIPSLLNPTHIHPKTLKNNGYRLPESLGAIRSKLKNHTNFLAEKCRKNNTIENIREGFEKTKNSGYTKNIIEQIKIVNHYLSNQPEEKFKSGKLRHRKIFVILDGQVIFSKQNIKGAYIEIPTLRYLSFLQSKKEGLELYYAFLAKCQEIFNTKIPFKSIFLLNGINVFELSEIPSQDKAVYISMSNIFRGVHLFNEKKTITTASDYNLLHLKEEDKTYSKGTKRLSVRIFMKKKSSTKSKLMSSRDFRTIKKSKKYLNEQSFTFGRDVDQLEQEEYVYYSENENKAKHKTNTIQEKYPTIIDQLLYFNDKATEAKIEEIRRNNIKRLRVKLGLRPNEDTEKGLDKLIEIYNTDRGKKFNINMSLQMNSKAENNTDEQQNALLEDTKGMGLALLKKLSIFKDYKQKHIILNENKFYSINGINSKETMIKKNIKLTYDVTPLADKNIQQYLPDLVSLNIPRVLDLLPKLKRKELYDIFVQFKTLLMFCVCINKNLKVMKKGIDFDTFFNCNSQIKSQGGDIALKIFKTINNLDSQFINWDQYMKGMLIMKSKEIGDKIDLFFKVIDTDGNGMLSFDEVYDLSIKSLRRSIGECNEDDDVVEMLAVYFSNLIFQLVDLPTDEEIPLDLIREKIIEGKSAAGYLEMFICADNFTD